MYPACETRIPIRKKDRTLVGMNVRAMLPLQARSSKATAKQRMYASDL